MAHAEEQDLEECKCEACQEDVLAPLRRAVKANVEASKGLKNSLERQEKAGQHVAKIHQMGRDQERVPDTGVFHMAEFPTRKG